MRQKFWKKNMQIVLQQIVFFISNLNLESFQLSFDIHIVHVGQKLWIFENCSTESQEISAVKVCYFGTTYVTCDGAQWLYRWIKMSAFSWDLFGWFVMEKEDEIPQKVWWYDPHPPLYRSTKKPTLFRVKVYRKKSLLRGLKKYLSYQSNS